MARTTSTTEPSAAELAAKEAAVETDAPTEAAPATGETVQQIKNRLRNEAERIVLDRHKQEFYEEAEKLYEANGFEFKRRLTEQEKAQQSIEKLLKENPELRKVYAPTTIVADHTPAD